VCQAGQQDRRIRRARKRYPCVRIVDYVKYPLFHPRIKSCC
jgi:hypothetical protein